MSNWQYYSLEACRITVALYCYRRSKTAGLTRVKLVVFDVLTSKDWVLTPIWRVNVEKLKWSEWSETYLRGAPIHDIQVAMPVYLLVVVWPKSLEASLPRTDGEVRDGTFARLIRKIVSVNLLALPRKARNSCFQELLAGDCLVSNTYLVSKHLSILFNFMIRQILHVQCVKLSRQKYIYYLIAFMQVAVPQACCIC